jgi:RsiW-degrading membrane proteinase PrsW (M82 family)
MHTLLSILTIFLMPIFTHAQEVVKQTFFIGRSFYFWALIVLMLYYFYLYKKSKTKEKFFKTTISKIILSSLALFLSAFLFVNVYLKDTRFIETSIAKDQPIISKILQEEKVKLELAEQQFTNIDLHYELIQQHFQIPVSWKEDQTRFHRDDYDLSNFYYDRLFFSDSLYVNIGRLGLGIINYHNHDYSLALKYLHGISIDTLPYFKTYLAKTYLQLGDTSNAIQYFELATTVPNKEYQNSMANLIELYSAKNLEDKLLSLAINPSTQAFIPTRLAQELYFKYNHLLLYSYQIFHIFSVNFKITGFIAAISILLIWLVYVVGLDIFEKENRLNILYTLVAGMCVSLLVFYISDVFTYYLNFDEGNQTLEIVLFYIFKVGLIEEFVKFIPVFIILLFAPKIINEPYDYILYACISALGFAFVENLLYFNGSLNGIIQGRALTSVPSHIINSSIVAYGLVLAKYRYNDLSSIVGFMAFFVLAAIAHGLYDFYLHKQYLVLFLFHLALSLSIWIVIINNCLNNSPSFSYKKRLHPDGIKITFSLGMISILLLQYVIVALENGPSVANNAFNSSLIIGGIIIIYYSDRLTNIDLVRGYWSSIPLRTIYEKQEGEGFDLKHFFIRLIAGNTMPHAFIGTQVMLIPDPANFALNQFFKSAKNGEIYDRIMVNCISRKTGEAYTDPYWFKLKTQNPVLTAAQKNDQEFIFKFDQTQPSFRKDKYLFIHLYTLKADQATEPIIQKKELRSLGTAILAQNY